MLDRNGNFRRLSLIFLLLTAIQFSCSSQKKINSNDKCKWEYDTLTHCKIYTWVDQMPRYNNGHAEALRFFTKHFHYPPNQNEFQGSITLEFIVTASGEIKDANIRNKSKSDLTEVDKEALRVLKMMPRWKPGKCNGVKVPVKMILPIIF